jgi:hypothetical protein
MHTLDAILADTLNDTDVSGTGDGIMVTTLPKTKLANPEWQHPSSPKPKRSKVAPSAGKFRFTVLWKNE